MNSIFIPGVPASQAGKSTALSWTKSPDPLSHTELLWLITRLSIRWNFTGNLRAQPTEKGHQKNVNIHGLKTGDLPLESVNVHEKNDMAATDLDRQHRRLERLRREGVNRSTVFVHEACRSALDSLRPMLLNPSQAPLIQQLLLEVQEKTPPTNVAQVVHLSPFRYPGGKTWLVPELRRWLGILKPISSFVEPFAGGASCGLMVAAEKHADKVLLGELDEDVAAVWRTLFHQSVGDVKWLCDQILKFEVSEPAVRAIIDGNPKTVRERAWRTIVRNRMQRGGILAPGAGLVKQGENGNGMASRWYPETLVKRIQVLQTLRGKVEVEQGDAFDLIAQHANDKRAAFLVDPPYTAGGKKAGARLYSHHVLDHERLFSVMASVKGSVMMTYDDAPEVRELATKYGFALSQVPMKSTHHQLHKELVLTRP